MKKKDSDAKTELAKPKIIENCKDVTPASFLSRNLPSAYEICISGGGDMIDPRRIDTVAIPWITKLTKNMVLDSGKLSIECRR